MSPIKVVFAGYPHLAASLWRIDPVAFAYYQRRPFIHTFQASASSSIIDHLRRTLLSSIRVIKHLLSADLQSHVKAIRLLVASLSARARLRDCSETEHQVDEGRMLQPVFWARWIRTLAPRAADLHGCRSAFGARTRDLYLVDHEDTLECFHTPSHCRSQSPLYSDRKVSLADTASLAAHSHHLPSQSHPF